MKSPQAVYAPQTLTGDCRRLTFAKPIAASRAFATVLSDLKNGLGHAYMLVCGDDETAAEFFTLTAAAVYCTQNKTVLTAANAAYNHTLAYENETVLNNSINKQAASENTATREKANSQKGKELYDAFLPFANNAKTSAAAPIGCDGSADGHSSACGGGVSALPPCLQCRQCTRVLNNNQPDAVYINTQSEKIKVGDVREALAELNVKSLSERKLYFFNRADLMSADAQNKLLKSLEEPPQNVTFMLGVQNEAYMLDTVKSRCRIIHMDLFEPQTVFAALNEIGCDKDKSAIAAACCEGMLGRALDIASSEEYAALYSSVFDILENLKKSPDVARLDSNKAVLDNMNDFLSVLSIVVRDMIVVRHSRQSVLSKHFAQRITALAPDFSERALAEIISLITDTRKKLSLNINAQACLDSLLFSILEVKFKWQ